MKEENRFALDLLKMYRDWYVEMYRRGRMGEELLMELLYLQGPHSQLRRHVRYIRVLMEKRAHLARTILSLTPEQLKTETYALYRRNPSKRRKLLF